MREGIQGLSSVCIVIKQSSVVFFSWVSFMLLLIGLGSLSQRFCSSSFLSPDACGAAAASPLMFHAVYSNWKSVLCFISLWSLCILHSALHFIHFRRMEMWLRRLTQPAVERFCISRVPFTGGHSHSHLWHWLQMWLPGYAATSSSWYLVSPPSLITWQTCYFL